MNSNTKEPKTYKHLEDRPVRNSGKFKNLEGKRYGMLTVGKLAGFVDRYAAWHVTCDCGKKFIRKSHSIKHRVAKVPQSCGCASRSIIDKYGQDTVSRWRHNRSIMCKEWKEDLATFAEAVGHGEGMKLVRLDHDKPLGPGNWTWSKDHKLYKTPDGQYKSIQQLADEVGMTRQGLHQRITKYGLQMALSKPKCEPGERL